MPQLATSDASSDREETYMYIGFLPSTRMCILVPKNINWNDRRKTTARSRKFSDSKINSLVDDLSLRWLETFKLKCSMSV